MKRAVEGSLLRYNARSLVIKSLLLQPLRIFYGQNFIQYKKRNISRTQGARWYRKKATTEKEKNSNEKIKILCRYSGVEIMTVKTGFNLHGTCFLYLLYTYYNGSSQGVSFILRIPTGCRPPPLYA
jgi:hypothetical protein